LHPACHEISHAREDTETAEAEAYTETCGIVGFVLGEEDPDGYDAADVAETDLSGVSFDVLRTGFDSVGT
jgi:hypothetical protein